MLNCTHTRVLGPMTWNSGGIVFAIVKQLTAPNLSLGLMLPKLTMRAFNGTQRIPWSDIVQPFARYPTSLTTLRSEFQHQRLSLPSRRAKCRTDWTSAGVGRPQMHPRSYSRLATEVTIYSNISSDTIVREVHCRTRAANGGSNTF